MYFGLLKISMKIVRYNYNIVSEDLNFFRDLININVSKQILVERRYLSKKLVYWWMADITLLTMKPTVVKVDYSEDIGDSLNSSTSIELMQVMMI